MRVPEPVESDRTEPGVGGGARERVARRVGVDRPAVLKVALPVITAQTAALEETSAHQVEVNRRQHDVLIHVHHELRTPVTVVVGATQTLHVHGDALEEVQRHRLREVAARNAKVLTDLVEDLTNGVDQALPGLSADGHVDNWSSTRQRR